MFYFYLAVYYYLHEYLLLFQNPAVTLAAVVYDLVSTKVSHLECAINW